MTQSGPEGKEKNKFLAFLIAIFLGPLGFHNFYVGRWKRGFFQFGLVFLSVGAGLLITIPWAWTEALLILIGKYQLSPLSEQKSEIGHEFSTAEEPVISAKKNISSQHCCFLCSHLFRFLHSEFCCSSVFYFTGLAGACGIS